MIPVIDLFAGPGGLGEGFSAVNYLNKSVFKIKLSIEKDENGKIGHIDHLSPFLMDHASPAGRTTP